MEWPYIATERLPAFKHTRNGFHKLICGNLISGLPYCFRNCSHSLFTTAEEKLQGYKGEGQTKQRSRFCSAVRECIKLDLHFTVKQLVHCRGDSWHLHFVVHTHPCYSICGEIKEHIFFTAVHTLVGSKDIYIYMAPFSLLNAYSILCMLCQNYFWEVQHRLHSEHE